ncbi:hypothetical protein EVAR_60630_1 [Eumeta japonica]|uniref:Uncharacterized protein n=1 Tax=Eumeta variegata TaxID=151549 RepID=A0A4C2A913_EUMVA|nr:hypothetical protein EVAR_60630_1 [Eumeta japonica]
MSADIIRAISLPPIVNSTAHVNCIHYICEGVAIQFTFLPRKPSHHGVIYALSLGAYVHNGGVSSCLGIFSRGTLPSRVNRADDY